MLGGLRRYPRIAKLEDLSGKPARPVGASQLSGMSDHPHCYYQGALMEALVVDGASTQQFYINPASIVILYLLWIVQSKDDNGCALNTCNKALTAH